MFCFFTDCYGCVVSSLSGHDTQIFVPAWSGVCGLSGLCLGIQTLHPKIQVPLSLKSSNQKNKTPKRRNINTKLAGGLSKLCLASAFKETGGCLGAERLKLRPHPTHNNMKPETAPSSCAACFAASFGLSTLLLSGAARYKLKLQKH